MTRYDRLSVYLPSDAELDRRAIERMVEESDCDNISQFIRECIESHTQVEGDGDG